MPMRLVVAAVIRQRNHVLLVHESAPEGPDDFWALPGGSVREGEFPPEALMREVREKIGIEIDVKDLVYIAQLLDATERFSLTTELPRSGASATVLAFRAQVLGGGILTSDSDDCVEARFMPPEDALERLSRQPHRFMAEPIASYLRGESDGGSAWFYRRDGDGVDHLVARIPGELSRRARIHPRTTRQSLHGGIGAAEYERRQQIVVLGCMVLVLVLVLLIIAGIIAITHKGP